MSIASELTTLATNKVNIKSALVLMNPDTPPTDVLSQWPQSIVSIPSGGTTDPTKPVKFYDYDGTLLHSYTVEEAQALTQMPLLPSHEGLSAQGWNYTLAEMKSCLSAVGTCDIGCMYTTDDGKTRITLTIQDAKYSEIPLVFQQTVENGVEVDWGDGSAAQTYSGTSQQTITHQYSPQSYPATYTVTFNVTDGAMSFPSDIMGKNGSEQGVDNPAAAWTNMIDSVRIGNGVTSIGSYVFYNCYSLASITIPSSVTSFGDRVFSYCYSLASINIPSSVTSFGTYTFYNCYSFASITIPNSVTTIGKDAFSSCFSLASVTIPSSVTSFGEYAFENCSSLASINIPSSVTSIGRDDFKNCSSLASVTIPSLVTSIGINGFSGCKSLASITIPNSVTKFSNSAFYGCCSLASITIPSSVTKIEGLTFQNCYGLKTYDFRTATAVPTLDNANAFSNTPSDKEIIVPDELYDTWITAGNWSSINGIVKASESSLGSLS